MSTFRIYAQASSCWLGVADQVPSFDRAKSIARHCAQGIDGGNVVMLIISDADGTAYRREYKSAEFSQSAQVVRDAWRAAGNAANFLLVE